MKNVNLSFLGSISDEEKILLNRVMQWADMAEEKYITRFSFFLDERQKMLCDKVLKSVGCENYRFFGGYESAQRTVLGIFPMYCEIEETLFPIVPLTFTYRKNDKLTHRDFLGSVMARQISRETVGDIIVADGKSVMFVYKTVASDVECMEKVGRVGVKISNGFDAGIVPIQNFQEISGTIASLRLDCVLSLALKISREKASALIKATGAEVNHSTVNSADFQLAENDVFSVRKYGKFILDSVGNTTKKNRIHIVIKKYV